MLVSALGRGRVWGLSGTTNLGRHPASQSCKNTLTLTGVSWVHHGLRWCGLPRSSDAAPAGALMVAPLQAATAEAPPASGTAPPPESPEDVVIVGACRTPSCRARKGALKDSPADELVRAVLQEVLRRTGVKPEEVGDVCLGSVFPPSSKCANEVRSALLLAGFPPSVPAYTVNRQCAAGLQAIANVAAGIRAGFIDVGIAGGVETLTKDPLDWQGSDSPRVLENQDARDVTLPLGLTAENVAEHFSVPRDLQDHYAAASHAKAAAAQAAGRFRDEIVPVEKVVKDSETGEEKRVSVDRDDGIRGDSTPEKLGQLKPYFKKGGTVTVGNACQNTDCAAAVLLMTRGEAQRRGLPIMGTLRSFATVGVPPAIMGIAPSKAIPAALDKAGLTKDDIDVYEVNEAFASQFAYCMRELGLDESKVNPNGGAIALGHPAGATGARQTVTLLHEMAKRTANATANGKAAKYGVVSMCTGSGMGAAAVFESGDSSASFSGSSSGSTSSSSSSGSVGTTDVA